jgi:hypothetical protein
MIVQHLSIADVEAGVKSGASLFDDHLNRMLLAVRRDPAMLAALQAILSAGTAPSHELYVRMHAAGILRGDSPASLRPRCGLYAAFLRRTLV